MARSSSQGFSKTLLLCLLFIIFCSRNVLSQQLTQISDGGTFETGRFNNALVASIKPDNRTIGVLLFVPKQNEKTPEAWATLIKQYFGAYGFPVKVFLYDKRYDGTGATAVIYIGGKAYQGNLSSGSVGLHYLLTNHETVFSEIAQLYKQANLGLFPDQD